MQVSPVPMKTRSGLVSATATAPIEAVVIWKSVTGAPVLAAVGGLPEAAAGDAEIGFGGGGPLRRRWRWSGRRGRGPGCASTRRAGHAQRPPLQPSPAGSMVRITSLVALPVSVA